MSKRKKKTKHRIGQIVYKDSIYEIKRTRYGGYTLTNTLQGTHSHNYELAKLLDVIDDIKASKVPDSHYDRETARRVCNDVRYKKKIEQVQERVRKKQKYYYVPKGCR